RADHLVRGRHAQRAARRGDARGRARAPGRVRRLPRRLPASGRGRGGERGRGAPRLRGRRAERARRPGAVRAAARGAGAAARGGAPAGGALGAPPRGPRPAHVLLPRRRRGARRGRRVVPARRARDYPHRLSGGMRQRVMIAMAISCEPRVLIADEPTTALDVTIQAEILDLLRALREQRGMALLLITHDLGVVAEQADEVAIMYAGRIVEQGSVLEIFDRPLHPYTQGLFRSIPGMGG